MRADERKKVVNKEFTEKRTTRTQSSETGVRLCFRLPVSLEFIDNYTPNGFSPQRYHMPVMQTTEGNPLGQDFLRHTAVRNYRSSTACCHRHFSP